MIGFSGGSDGKECAYRELGSISGSQRSFGEGIGYPPQYSCLENSMERGTWQATFHGVPNITKQLIFSHFNDGKTHLFFPKLFLFLFFFFLASRLYT